MKKLIRVANCLLIAVTLLLSNSVFASNTIAEALDWKPGHTSHHACGLCGGYYSEPKSLKSVPHPPNYKTVPIVITSKGPVIFRANGASVLQDDVVIRQPGRLAHADKAVVYHNPKTGKITDIKLFGHVRIQEEGKLLIGDKADYDIEKNTLTLNHVIYHIAGKHELLSVVTPFDAWGTASYAHRDANGVITLKNAKYSTCPPTNPSWVISAESMILDHNTGKGYAHNAVIRFKKIPIFYTPYFSFPLNDNRKSGLLAPGEGLENGTGQSGFYISFPYYWNMAPNYDLLFTPTWYSQRGTQLNGLFRYLTGQSDGSLYASFLPGDREFVTFRRNTLNTVANYSKPDAVPYFSQLSNNTNNRVFINFQNNTELNQFWSGKFDIRYLSDAYYAEDFQSEYLSQTTNQIPSFAELTYQNVHWQDTFLVQSYQTLHPLDQYNTPAQNQYTRLPELDFNADYPQFSHHLDFDLSAQSVNFDYASAFVPYTYQMPTGERLHFAPSISRPFDWASFYLTPELTADSTSYFSQLSTASSALSRPTLDANRTLPIFDIDSGLYFNRFVQIGGKHYIQTLEPRVFYLYTPYLNQNNYPNFDTQALPFSTTNLYSLNQFTGFDRLQNANQISLGLTSNLMRAKNASDVLSAQLGLIDYFTTPSVCLAQGCQIVPQSISPITGALTWNPNPLWSILSQAAWDTSLGQVNNAQLGVQYHFLTNHLIVLNYQFTHGNPNIPFNGQGFNTSASLLTAGLVWPLTFRWHFFGYTYYDITHNRPQNQYVGLSYDTCCWALRFIASDDYNGTTTINGSKAFQNQYSSTYYIEFLLKGLGSVGTHNAEEMLMNTLPGFQDVFSNKGHYEYDQGV